MRGERAQVTLFFIVGIVLLFTVAILYLFIGQEKVPVIENTLDPQLSGYLSSCIDTIVEDELRRIGDSGGLLPSNPVGRPPYGLLEGEENSIIFGITQNRNDYNGRARIAPDRHEPPRYPAWQIALSNTERNEDLTPMHPFQDGYFGDVWLRALCDAQGSNAPGSAYNCRHYPGVIPGSSIQSSLYESMQSRITACAAQTVFEQSFGVQIQSIEDPLLNITFTPNSVLIATSYTLRVADRTQPVTLDFNRQYDVRLLSITQFAQELAQEESRNATFSIAAGDYQNLLSYKEGFIVSRDRDAEFTSTWPATPALAGADLIVIADSGSELAGRPFRFRFLAEHRLPMIDNIENRPLGNSCPAIDPDETAVSCGWYGNTLVAEDEQGQRDCLHFAGDFATDDETACPSS